MLQLSLKTVEDHIHRHMLLVKGIRLHGDFFLLLHTPQIKKRRESFQNI